MRQIGCALGLWLAACAAPSAAQLTGISGSFASAPGSPGARVSGSFACQGLPNCRGQYTLVIEDPFCTNTLRFGDEIVITGLELAQSGALSGTVSIVNGEYQSNGSATGPCTAIAGARSTFNYTGSWDLAAMTGSLSMVTPGEAGVPGRVDATFKGEVAPPPAFPMTVRSTIGTTTTAVADIQFRPQDVGTTGSIFVFAAAPAALVQGGNAPGAMKLGLARNLVKAFEKADSCVITQLNSAGQLVAVTGGQLQAFLSGTLSAAGASVSIADRVPTPNVAGATFYVGYGTSAQRMLTDGIFRNAVLVPGSDVCPMMPAQTALWWNPRESGWGINLNHQGATIFGTLFTYDANRAPLWLVMSGGRMQMDGVTYTGDLYRTTGPAFSANPFTPIGASNLTRVGAMTLKFGDANAGTLTYTVNNVQVVKDIQRQVYGTRAANCLPTTESRVTSTNYQDLWWNPAESGWGLNITHQDNILFATLFTYDASGRDLWLVMSAGARQSDGSFLGDLFQTSGPAFNATSFSGVTVQTVGTMRLRFTDGNTGTLTYTYNGVTVTKSIQRQVFSTTFSTCN